MKTIIAICFFVAFVAPSADAGEPADVALGRAIYEAHCSLCHDNSEHMINDAGPALFGVVGRRVGSVEGYDYSPALEAANRRGDRWTVKRLDRFLTNPETLHPGTDMPMRFEGARMRAGIIAYLKTLGASDR